MARAPKKPAPAPQPAAEDTKPDTSERAALLAVGQKKED